MIGRRHGVHVRFANVKTASTTGKMEITLPVLPDVAPAEHEALVIGLLDHEICHVRRTDFRYLSSSRPPLTHCLWNIFEDIWIERVHARQYPGAFENIKTSVLLLQKMDPTWYGPLNDVQGTQPPGPAELLVHWMLRWTCGRHYNFPIFVRNSEAYRNKLETLVGAAVIDEIEQLAGQCLTSCVESTASAVQLAEQVMELLKQHQAAADDASQRSEQSSGEGNDADGAASGAGQGQVVDAEAEAIAQALAEMIGASKDNCPTTDLADKISEFLKEHTDPEATFQVPAALNQAPRDGKSTGIPKMTGAAEPDPLVSEAVRILRAGLGLRLESYLEAFVENETMYAARGRKLAPRRLSGLRTGKMTIFQKDTEGEAIDTAMGILVDVSSSMFSLDTSGLGIASSGENPRYTKAMWSADPASLAQRRGYEMWLLLKLAQEGSINDLALPPAVMAAAIGFALGSCIDRFEIPFSLNYFGSSALCVKDFDDLWRRCSTPFVRDLSCTELLEPAILLGRSLALRGETRKSLAVITDGDPSEREACAIALAEVQKLGVDVVILFVGEQGTEFETLLHEQGLQVFRVGVRQMGQAPQVIVRALQRSMERYRAGK